LAVGTAVALSPEVERRSSFYPLGRRELMKKILVALALLALSLPHAAAGQDLGYRKGDFVISPMMPGIMLSANLPESPYISPAAFGLFNDFDYHLNRNWTIGALLNLGFGTYTQLLDVGPQLKYKFDLGNGHHPYVRAAFFTYRFRRINFEGFGFSSENSGIGLVSFGLGYKYKPHRLVSVGVDLELVPTEMFFDDALGGARFVFGVNLLAGVEVRI
jgi:hypothetical protein